MDPLFEPLCVDVTVRGKAFKARALSDFEERLIDLAFPAPKAPLIKDPTRGSAAPPIPDTQDAVFRAETAEMNANIDAAACAAMLDVPINGVKFSDVLTATHPGGTVAGGVKEWAKHAARTLRDQLTGTEIRQVVQLVVRASALPEAIEAARKNS